MASQGVVLLAVDRPRDRWEEARVREPGETIPVGRLFLAAVLVAFLVGCSATAPRSERGVDVEPEAGTRWACEAREGSIDAPWYEGFESWQEDRGVMSSVHGTSWGRGDAYGRPTEEEALRDALTSAASSALDLLERRGLTYGSGRRNEIESRTVETLLRGEEPSFPRVRIGGKVVERCRDPETGESTWRARVLVEYSIGELRGDVVNVVWERERTLREVGVLRMSAAAHFSEGRWLDGKLDLERALELLRGTGTSLADTPERRVQSPPWGREDATQAERVWWHETEIRGTAAPLSIRPLRGIDVVEIGARAGAEAAFLVTCAWGGEDVPAIGVPMRYEIEGEVAAILDGDRVTDEEGIARCRVLRVYGAPGEYRLVGAVDDDFVRSAGISAFGDVVVHADGPSGGRTSYHGGPEAYERLFLVEGGHGVTVCADFAAERERDAAEARAGFIQRMSNDGFLAEECGHEVDVVVTAAVRLVTGAASGTWSAEVTVAGSAFDQRFAREIGESEVTVAEESDEGQRDAEFRALREAGRLLAVYFSRRILTSGE
jgi:hypothetical protein